MWKPCHNQPFMRNYYRYEIFKTNELYKKCFCLPSGFNINDMKFKKIKEAFVEYESLFNHK